MLIVHAYLSHAFMYKIVYWQEILLLQNFIVQKFSMKIPSSCCPLLLFKSAKTFFHQNLSVPKNENMEARGEFFFVFSVIDYNYYSFTQEFTTKRKYSQACNYNIHRGEIYTEWKAVQQSITPNRTTLINEYM